jgi:CRISPR/Cas system-associated exonuclease Cas4 (RecB family)
LIPQLQRFANEYMQISTNDSTRSDGALLEEHGRNPGVRFQATSVEAVEENLVSPELGLKGNVDMVVQAKISIPHSQSNCGSTASVIHESLVGIELKTGHSQHTQNAHVAQLALYVLMLQARHGYGLEEGAMDHAVLVYINSEAIRAIHLTPLVGEIKSLIGQRNLLAIETRRASLPRGVLLAYENDTTVPNPRTK